jgi:hypothetical protein
MASAPLLPTSPRFRWTFPPAATSARAAGLCLLLLAPAALAPGQVVISQVYGGAGAGKTQPFDHDFVELFNRGGSAVSLAGWSVQYAADGASSWEVAPLGGAIAPGGYYLVPMGAGVSGDPLPAPDAAADIPMGTASGKVALVADTTALSGGCPVVFTVDLVGYATAYTDPGTGFSYSCDPGAPNIHFADVPASNPFCKHIHYLWAKNVVSGCGATTYCPGGTVNRDAMAKFLANGFGLKLYGP